MGRICGYVVDIIHPDTLCNKQLCQSKINLNRISHDSARDLIRKAIAYHPKVNITEVYVDTVGPKHADRKSVV